MNMSYSIVSETARQRQQDILTTVARDRQARQVQAKTRSAQPLASRARRRTWRLAHQPRMLAES